MANLQRNFVLGRMNKDVDQRLVRNGEYLDAVNIRIGSDESNSEIGAVSNVKGNTQLTTLRFLNTNLSSQARCIGAYEDGEAETIYWFVHDSNYPSTNTGKIDMIVSFNINTSALTYHVVSIDDGGGANTTLNFDEQYLVTGVDLVDDMLFFTDNLNPPRKINVSKAYPVASAFTDVDQYTAEELLVIKRPPINSPSIQSLETGSQNNFLDDRFVSFAYRYRYEDGEYSATSQFSAPSFIPKRFKFTTDAFLNEGMTNLTNACIITYNTGSNLVKDVELLFKDMNSGIIKVIENLNKEDLGLVDGTDYTFTFSNSKVFTVLPDSEILRLYDNVPRLSQAQTIMGNRLVYGNYVEGYDLKDSNGNPIKLEYTTEVLSNSIGDNDVNSTFASSLYTINGAVSIAGSLINIDLSGLELKQGSLLSITLVFDHSTFTDDTPPPVQTTNPTEINFTYLLTQDYNSVFELANNVDFIEKIGTTANIKSVADSCTGDTFTDIFNCSIPQNLDALTRFESGISGVDQPIAITSSTSSDVIGFQLPAMRFVNNVNIPTFSVYEYYEIISAEVQFVDAGATRSLHSNRGYEVGVVYMDDYNRSSTALVSGSNNNHIPCSSSDLKNKIRVTIPNTQVAPSWATRYKFAIKPDKENYETVYSNIFFNDTQSDSEWLLLEGENTRKVEVGDRLIVKADVTGALNRCAYTTILDKGAKEENFLTPAPVDEDGSELYVPSGVYVKVKSNDFSAVLDKYAQTDSGFVEDTADRADEYPKIGLVVNEYDGTTYFDEPIPTGSQIDFYFKTFREGGSKCGNGACERREFEFDMVLTASKDYDNLFDFFVGDNVIDTINAQGFADAGCDDTPPNCALLTPIINYDDIDIVPVSSGTNNLQFLRNTNNRLVLAITGTRACGRRDKLNSSVEGRIIITRRSSLLVFETEPQDALPDLWYESSTSYPITAGLHTGNIQDQTASLPAIIDTAFFNCFAFGNGVESYKVRDSIVGKPLELGNRTTTTSAQDFIEAHRFADLTYSGVFNDESNVNKLNEFNLGLLNFKPLEDDFGPVMKLDGRQTDILVLQEDKISYVLAGKNLISDSTGGGVISSVPEVLGTQVARSEEYGISMNPESYAKWGYDKFFTDKKRGAVINLRGSSYGNEQLQVISKLGMTTYFRDEFITSFSKQQLGGYDPYYNEYILTRGDIDIPALTPCIECGTTRTLTIVDRNPLSTCYELGNLVGDSVVSFSVVSGGDVTVEATYDGDSYTSGAAAQTGGFTIDKDKVSVTTADFVITAATTNAVVELTVKCPDADELTVIQVCVTSNADAGKFIHNEYRWTDGVYISPLHSTQVEFVAGADVPLVSQYDTITGLQGGAFIPANGATVSIRSNKLPPIDDFDFDSSIDEFKYLRSNTLYSNNPTDIANLISSSFPVAPITGSSPLFSADFTMPTIGNYLYLIYIYDTPTIVDLCYASRSVQDSCCGCTTPENLIVQECTQDGSVNQQIVERTNETRNLTLGEFVSLTGYPNCVFEVIAFSTSAPSDTIVSQIDIPSCSQVCGSYTITNTTGTNQTAIYIDCNLDLTQMVLSASETVTDVCLRTFVNDVSALTITKTSCSCTSSLKVRQCRLDGSIVEEIIPATASVDVGSFVTLTSYATDCTFEVVEYSMATTTDTVATILSITNCDDACNTYTIANGNPSVVQIQYESCAAGILNISIPPKSSELICAKRLTSALPPLVTMTWETCGCSA